MAYVPKLSAKDIARALKDGVLIPGAPVPRSPGVTEGVITCPHCGEPVPVRVAVEKVDVIIQFPRKKWRGPS